MLTATPSEEVAGVLAAELGGDGGASRRPCCAAVNRQGAKQLLRLTLLSPTLVRSILDGHQPKTLSLLWLKNNLPPSDWGEQHRLFNGFDA